MRRILSLVALLLVSFLALGQGTNPTTDQKAGAKPAAAGQATPTADQKTAAKPATASAAAPTGQGRFDFNHDRTGFRLEGAHQKARCESCHVEGIFKGTPKTCNSCHTVGKVWSTVVTQNPTHISVLPSAPCDTCHVSTTSFRVWRMDHTATAALCSTCHNGQNFEGLVPTMKPATHPQTTADCSLCHQTSLQTNQFQSSPLKLSVGSSAAWGIPVGSGVGFGMNIKYYDHTGVTGNCANCHNGATAQGKPVGHIPTTLPCEQCHTTIPVQMTAPSSFQLWTMDHTGIVSGCASCHNGQTFLGVTPLAKPAGHKPTTLPCEDCHTQRSSGIQVPGGFAVATATFDHVANHVQPGTCTSCHNGSAATGQIAGHIATNGGTQCDVCHTMGAASFSTWTMGNTGHAAVSAACSACHATGKSFPGATMVTLPAGALHIPTAAQCSTCHASKTTFTTWTMDHTGIASGCATCHNTGAPYPGGIVTKPASGHIPTSKPCEACHTSTSTPGGFQTWRMDHTGIVTGCAACHDTGVSFTPWNGAALVTKPVGHIPTASACELCHPASQTNVGGFVLPITGMNHTGIVSNCSSCHNGSTFTNVTPMYKPTNHVLTSQDCSACHTSTTIPGGFAAAASSFDHVKAGVQAGTCTSCHNGTNATGMIGGHIGVNAGTQCDACHSYTLGSFSKWTMDHTKVSTSCTSCHSSGSTFPGATMVTLGTVNHFPTTAQCSTCHTSTKVPGGFATWTMDHSQVATTACAVCHDTGKSFSGSTPVVTKPAGHMPVGSTACDQCHTSTTVPNGFRTWTMSHTAVSSTPCSTCHNAGVSFTPWNGTPALVTKATPAKHIPTTGECSNCHTSTTVTGGFAQWTMNHTGITSGCTSCHDPSVASGFTNVTIVTKPAGHLVTTADCVTCHSSTSPGGFATFTGTGGNPHTSGAPSPTCTNCHGNAAAVAPNTPAPGQPAGHITVNAGVQCGACHSDKAPSFANWNTAAIHANVNTATCATCHGPGKNFPGKNPMVTSASATHIPVTGDCALCHTTTTVPGGFKTWSMNHAGVTTTPCATCHGTATASTFTNTAGTPILTMASVTHIPGVSGDCSSCHTSTTVTGGFATWTMNHTAVSFSRCDTCHGATASSFTNHGLAIKTMASYPGHQAIGTLDCASCHSGYTSFVTSVTAHNHTAADAGQCNTCHTGTGGGKTQIAGHIPTGALSCDAGGCHTYTTMSFATLSSGNLPAMHASLANNLCAQCHRDAGDQTIGSSPLALLKGKPSGHIPVPVNTCNNCHTTQSSGGFAIFAMNHTTVAGTPCATCHDSTASFMAGTPALVTKPSGATGHIPTTATCDQCHLNTTIPGGFKNTAMNHAAVTGTPCASCHATGLAFSPWNGTALVTKSVNHIPVGSATCDQCHASTTSFATWTMNHTAVAGTTCATCHDTGKSFAGWVGTPTLVTKGSGAPNHIPTTQACNLCHTSTAVPGGFAQWTMNHTGIVTNCSQCHSAPANTSFTNAVIVTKPAGHIVTTADCSTCHTNTNPGGFATFTNGSGGNPHTAANPGVCANCHGNASAVAPYTPAPGMITGHITTTSTDCGACHSWSAASFAVWTMDHTKVSTTCATCHGPGKTFPGTSVVTTLSVTHIPVTGDCNVCHATTTVPGGFATWTMNHSGVTTTPCANCHGAGKSFTNSVGIALKTIASVNHIPLTGGDCSNCHSTTTVPGGFANWTMDHTYVNVTSCSACHGTGVSFTNTGAKTIVTKPATHIPTTSDCSACHSGYVSFVISSPATSTNHTGFTTCNSCHTGQTYQGVTPVTKPANHIVTAADCSSCHANPGATPTVGGFKYPNWTMNHGAVTATPCANCHGIGKSFAMTTGTLVTQLATHFPTTGDCSVCHTSYSTFVIPSPYTGMVHAGGVNTATCNGCHGTSAGITFGQGSITPAYAGLNAAAHPGYPTNCQSCHTSFTVPGGFKVATFSHSATATPANGCYSCHGTGTNGAKMEIAGHIPTGTTSCDACHSYSAMSFATPIGMNHTVVAATGCSTCHKTTGNQTIGSSSLATVVGEPSTHIAILSSVQCNLCHTSQVTGGFTTWTMNHAGVTTGTCMNCHNGQSFQGLVPGYPAATGIIVNKPSNHITTTSACSSCHGSTTSFKISGTSMNHAGISSGCQNCHAGQSFSGLVPGYPGGTGIIVNKPANHIATLAANTDCAVCHSSTTTFTAWVMNHSGVNAATCQNCHQGQSFQGATPGSAPGAGIVVNKAANHIVTTKDCNTCHISTTTFAGGQMGTTQHIANGNVTSCATCHNGQSFQGLTPGPATGSGIVVNKPSNHITTGLDCSICHSTSNFSTFAGTWTFGSSQHSSNGNAAANCISCHNGQVFANGVTPVNKLSTPSPGHVPTNADCSNCHTNTGPGGFASHLNLSSKHSATYMTSYSSSCYPTCHGTTTAIWYGVEYQALRSVSEHNPLGTKTNCANCHRATSSSWD